MSAQIEARRLTDDQRVKFLTLVKDEPTLGNVAALRQLGVPGTKGELRALLDADLLDEAREARGYGDNTIRQEIHRRAIEGVDEPVFHQGQIAGYIRRYSDRLLAKMADAYLPEYKDVKRLEVTGDGGGPVQLEGRAVVGLADVNRLAVKLGIGHLVGLDAGDPGAQLPPAPPVLPEPDDR